MIARTRGEIPKTNLDKATKVKALSISFKAERRIKNEAIKARVVDIRTA